MLGTAGGGASEIRFGSEYCMCLCMCLIDGVCILLYRRPLFKCVV